MNNYHKLINVIVVVSITFLMLACNTGLSNLTYEPIRTTSFNKNDTLYSFQYMVSNKYANKKQFFLVKNKTKSLLKNYYWFENGKLFCSQGSFSGKLLHGNYIEKYKSGQIKSKGSFSYGLKDKTWLNYFDSGMIKSSERWDNGTLKEQLEYSEAQKLIAKLKFNKGRKNGWEYVYDSITVVSRVKYKNGEIKRYLHFN